MAVVVDSAIAFALQQPGVKPACLVSITTASAEVLRFAVDTITWSGLTYQARLKQPPRLSVSPAAPERGQVGATTLSLELVDPDGAFGQYRPGYFEGQSCSVAYVLTDVESTAFRTFGFKVTDVAKPDLLTFNITGEDGLSALRRSGWPPDPWLMSNVGSLSSGLSRPSLAMRPVPQSNVDGPNRVLPIKIGQAATPAVLQWTAAISDISSIPYADAGSVIYSILGVGSSVVGPVLVQRWNDSFSAVVSMDFHADILNGTITTGIFASITDVHCGTPLLEGGQVVPLYDVGPGLTPESGVGILRHTITPIEVFRCIVDSSYNNQWGLGIPIDAAAANSWHAVYRGLPANSYLALNAGSLTNMAFHGFQGVIQDQRPADQWLGEVLHDGMMGVVWRDSIVPVPLCFSRACVASFTTANIVEGTLSWRDTPPAQLETTRTIFYRRQVLDVEPVTSFTWSAAARGASTSRTSELIGHAVSAWRPAQFWARREADARRRYSWRTGFFAFGMEQHDLVTLDYQTVGASGQLCEVEAVELLPDWSVQVQAREASYAAFTFTNTPTNNWAATARFNQRVKFPQSSWALGTSGDSFYITHGLKLTPDYAAGVFISPLLALSYPSSLMTATDSDANIWVRNVANSGAVVSAFQNVLLAWDVAKLG